MILYPAMDLMRGEVVRLKQGRFDDATSYSADPAAALAAFAAAGATWAHVVDLDGAHAGTTVQHQAIMRLVRSGASLALQVGGGIRRRDEVARLLDAGVARVVVGSLAADDPRRVRGWLEEFGTEQLALALDVSLVRGNPVVMTAGWTKSAARSLWEVAAEFPPDVHLLVTDIGRDGMLEGPNLTLLDDVAERLPEARVQASGGVSSLDDLRRLSSAGVIVGRALWEGRFSLEEALDAVA
ncbi:HisA/HisF-related TIM barrel protein [Allosphingosinicella indica]|uniref:1-(5-phosphoribosyl)-5-[(5-phosphoribosylamino)methylideneamino] imidazole-4-carboxamide isomerase n=1 Tax=Allosphingosinicella indica TaxID=941907 RepID=A0A1X7FYG8_9SPHN|nr:1-(5-phosphoribosyl)-5-[(5-phosphoribosylamino)methylideneamino] imidazole-4-carboxamide isomerase [Allosphingosinicella indica]SMF61089.1 1-(5-phosphoribosyl)-5-[(5-phosphoribosylamino)methylideneamino] imidazole-4-carboxamide isomerase [Allosphingosinicella indica]